VHPYSLKAFHWYQEQIGTTWFERPQHDKLNKPPTLFLTR